MNISSRNNEEHEELKDTRKTLQSFHLDLPRTCLTQTLSLVGQKIVLWPSRDAQQKEQNQRFVKREGEPGTNMKIKWRTSSCKYVKISTF